MKRLFVALVVSLLSTGCAYRVVDDAVLTRPGGPAPKVDVADAKPVEAGAYYPYLIGFDLRRAVDKAFAEAGPEYDMLVNASITVKHYYVLIYFSQYVFVRGDAVRSEDLRAQLGEESYQRLIGGPGVISRGALRP